MWYILLWLTVLVSAANSVWVVEVNRLFKSCGFPNKNAPFPLDLSKINIYLSEDDKLVLNGEMKFTQDVVSPWGISVYTEKLEHGAWRPTPYTKSSFNLCLSMHATHEMWYSITKHLNQSSCPFRKGHVEKFDMAELGTFGFDEMLAEFGGDWRIFLDFSLGSVPNKVKISCTMSEVSVLEH